MNQKCKKRGNKIKTHPRKTTNYLEINPNAQRKNQKVAFPFFSNFILLTFYFMLACNRYPSGGRRRKGDENYGLQCKPARCIPKKNDALWRWHCPFLKH